MRGCRRVVVKFGFRQRERDLAQMSSQGKDY